MIVNGLPLLTLRQALHERYVAPRGGGSTPPPARNRAQHAAAVRSQIDAAARELAAARESLATAPTAAVVTVAGPDLDKPTVATQLAPPTSDAQLLTSDEGRVVFRVEDDLAALRTKVVAYQTQNTASGNPKNNNLIARIDQLSLATITDLSHGEIQENIDDDVLIWVEIWTLGGPDMSSDKRAAIDAAVAAFAELTPDGAMSMPVYRGPERDVHVVLANGESLKALPILLPDAAEVHRAPTVLPIVLAEAQDAAGEVADVDPPDGDAAVVAVHDSGIDSNHPYVAPILQGAESVVPGEAATNDADGHGTQMAGVAAYSRLAEGVAGGVLTADAWLVAMRLLDSSTSSGGDPERGAMWAERTSESVTTAETLGGGRTVIHNISIGADNPTIGRTNRTAWSVAADVLAWNNGAGRLVVVAGGNHADIIDPDDYPLVNLGPPFLQQPGQGWNVLTVGGYTNLDELTAEDEAAKYPDPLARAGELSPHSRTSAGSNLPIKPDIVMEAGNTAPGSGLSNPEAQGLTVLTLRSTARLGGSLLRRTCMTSPAAAAASNALARIANSQPDLRPASWRALLVHSARWPEAAVRQFTRRDLLRSFGYGVPAPDHAASSSSNRPVMIYEGFLRPSQHADKATDRRVDYVEIPFPEEELHAVGDLPARLSVTLSYFVDPTDNLTRRSYAGGRLRWDLQGPTEESDSFRARINKVVREQGVSKGAGSYGWEIGPDIRSRSTLQHDFAQVAAADLAATSPRLLAVYPVLGWWEDSSSTWSKTLPYSVVVSVDFGEADVDLHALISSTLIAVPPIQTSGTPRRR